MKLLVLSLAAYGAAALFSLSPFGHARAQSPIIAVPAVAERDWRHQGGAGADGQFAYNQTASLKVRRYTMAARIHWANMSAHTLP